MAASIKMPLDVELGLSPGDFVLNGDPAPPSPKGGAAPQIFGPCLLWPNGWVDEAGTWHGGRPHPRRLCVRWGPSPPPQKRAEPIPQFSAHFYCGQTAECIKMPLGMDVGLSPGNFVLDGDAVPLPNNGAEPPPKFWAHVYCGQSAGWIKMPLGTKVGLSLGDCARLGPIPLPTKGVQPLLNFRLVV